ncbi:MAG TPA: RluA family pseudouridine synthase [Steroidobacteraceae bacterium]|nr:RluA family pseudouridine synthase [Steroidobacteraceae bacterium]
MSYESKPDAPPEPGKVSHVAVIADDDGQRLDNWLMRSLKGVPRSRVYRLLRKGEVRVNGRRARPDTRLATGDDVRLPPVRAPEPGAPRRVPQGLVDDVEAAIVHADADLLVVAKPAGLAVHGGSGLAFGVIEALRASRPTESLELVHRLDRDTSGLLLVARNRTALRTLHGLLREGQVEKRYLALVQGAWNLGKKTIRAPLATRARQGGTRVVRVAESGKESDTTFEPVDFFGARATLMQVSLGTGRTHQIRVHAAHAGHPVAGDDKYGARDFNAEMAALGLRRLFLHAQSLSFEWPGSRKTFAVNQPLPPDLAAVLETLAASRKRRGRR